MDRVEFAVRNKAKAIKAVKTMKSHGYVSSIVVRNEMYGFSPERYKNFYYVSVACGSSERKDVVAEMRECCDGRQTM